MALARIRTMGDTPNIQISKAPDTGIQAFRHVIRADLAVLNTGAMIRATTAGRIPLKMRSITGLSVMREKKMAMSSIRINDGATVPNVAAILPRVPFSLFPTRMDMFTAKIPGRD